MTAFTGNTCILWGGSLGAEHHPSVLVSSQCVLGNASFFLPCISWRSRLLILNHRKHMSLGHPGANWRKFRVGDHHNWRDLTHFLSW